jgi:hypothetical protein
VIEVATSVPKVLRDYVLKHVEEAVTLGEGPTRRGQLSAEGINASEVAILKRVIFGTGSERPAGVSQSEAEMLFRIKDATLYEPNAPEWHDLFVKGVAHYLLGFGGHEALDETRAAELEAFMNSEGAGIGGFLGRVARADVEDGFASLLKVAGEEDDVLAAWDDDADAAGQLDPAEQSWLQDMLDADEELDDMEKALIAFIDEETGESFVPRPAAAG